MVKLQDKKLFVLDMDGTFYLGNRVLEGSLEFIEKLRSKNKEFMFFTNNASKTASFYIHKLSKMGLDITEKNIKTAGDVTAQYLLSNYKDKRIYLVATDMLKEEYISKGINVVKEDPDIVTVSFDMTLTYEKLRKACTYIRRGALFIATHMDINCPTEDGFIPDCGAICELITKSTGVRPRFLGKPFKETVDMIEEISGIDKEHTVIIGDRLYTDIATGFNNNVTSVLVLSGETSKEDLRDSKIKPDFVFETLKDMIEVI